MRAEHEKTISNAKALRDNYARSALAADDKGIWPGGQGNRLVQLRNCAIHLQLKSYK